jgi:hypothetical protein
MRHTLAALVILATVTVTAQAAVPPYFMLELNLQGQKVEGTLLTWSETQVNLLSRDGRLLHFHPREAAGYHKTADRFRSLPVSEFRALLLRELGSGYEVSGTDHYLVAHPAGTGEVWTQRFEDLYRSFFHYFAVRGFRPEEPDFPLVGIVAGSREEFQRFSAEEGSPAAAGVLGYYALQTNRIMLYDVGGGRDSSSDWRQNAATAIHEATHQTAFNTGIHSRYAPPPLWVAEGLATLFEAPGVNDSDHHPNLAERVNRGRYVPFIKGVSPRHRPELLGDVVASDAVFQSAPAAAYAEAWALTFYLVETQPAKYFQYLARTARRPPFSAYTAAERTADFTAVFGNDWPMLEAQFLRFMRDPALAL